MDLCCLSLLEEGSRSLSPPSPFPFLLWGKKIVGELTDLNHLSWLEEGTRGLTKPPSAWSPSLLGPAYHSRQTPGRKRYHEGLTGNHLVWSSTSLLHCSEEGASHSAASLRGGVARSGAVPPRTCCPLSLLLCLAGSSGGWGYGHPRAPLRALCPSWPPRLPVCICWPWSS